MSLSSPRRVRRVATAGLAVAATAGAAAAFAGLPAASAAGSSSTVALANSRPAWAQGARDLGSVAAGTRVDFEVLLNLRDASGAMAALQAMSTPGNARFRHFLTPAQFRAAYSPSTATVAAVSRWVRSVGLHVASVAPSRLYVEVTGTAAQASRLVGTPLHNYSVKGQVLAAGVASYRIPAGLARQVGGIVNLDGTSNLVRPTDTLPPPAPGARYGVQPCSTYYGQKMATNKPKAYGRHWPYTVCGYYGPQLEKAYGLAGPIHAGIDGRGVTVAITDAYSSPTMPGDANTWSHLHGLPTFKPGQFVLDTPKADGYSLENECGPQGWYGEETLDIEAVHSMAPGARILYGGAANCGNGLNLKWASIIDHHLATVVTNSWSYGSEALPAGLVNFFTEYLLQAGTTGITVMFSSGDYGDEKAVTGTKQVAMPASDPLATGVGGTSTEIGAKGQIVFQHGWSNAYSVLQNGKWTPPPPGNFSSGSGGGTSRLFAQPWYQQGVVPASISEYFGKHPARAVPDVAMPGDPNTGLRIGQTQTFPNGTYYSEYRLGGTSLSSPLFAGVVADANQYNGAPVGFINPLLYKYIDTSAITDVYPPSSPTATVRTNYTNNLNPSQGYTFILQTIDWQGQTIHTLPGYDDETGVGTPNGMGFLAAMKY